MNAVVEAVKPAGTALAVNLTFTDVLKTQVAAAEATIETARAFAIECQEDADQAGAEMNFAKKMQAGLRASLKAFVEPAKQILDNAEGLFRPGINAAEEAERILKGKLGAWIQKEQARIALENAERERVAREARLKAEQEAARARAEADAIAEQKRKAAEDAERKAAEAQKSGDGDAAAQLAGEAASLAAQASAVQQQAQHTAQEAIVQAAALAIAAEPAEAPKLANAGVSMVWEAKLAQNVEEAQMMEMVMAAIVQGGRRDLLCLFSFEWGTAKRMASVQGKSLSIPGVIAEQVPQIKGRRK